MRGVWALPRKAPFTKASLARVLRAAAGATGLRWDEVGAAVYFDPAKPNVTRPSVDYRKLAHDRVIMVVQMPRSSKAEDLARLLYYHLLIARGRRRSDIAFTTESLAWTRLVPPLVLRKSRKRAKKPGPTLQQRRADHAAEKWRDAKRKLKIAQTVEKRWREKVRYYERVIGKRARSRAGEIAAAAAEVGGELDAARDLVR